MQLKPAILEFLKKLKKNNRKEWFDKNRSSYEQARENFMQFTEGLIREIAAFDPGVKHLTAKECVFRIYRDVRFSKDKTPYKIHFAASLSKEGKKIFHAGYYFHLEPGNNFFAGGMYSPPTEIAYKVRQEIDYNREDFLKIIRNKDFKKYFGKLSEEEGKMKFAPKGYENDHPLIEYLKLKHFLVINKVSDKDVTSPRFLAYCGKVCKAMKPLNDFLSKATTNYE